MPDFITLSCPSCGNKLQITSDIDRFACSACGNEHVVNRSGGIVTLKPIIESIAKVQVGVDKTASELAIVRLNKEITEIEERISVKNKSRPTLQTTKFPPIFLWVFGILFIGAAIALIISVALFDSNEIVGGVFFLIIAIMVLAIPLAIVWALRSKMKNKAKRKFDEQNRIVDEEIKKLNDLLEVKNKEFSEHQNLVSKYK